MTAALLFERGDVPLPTGALPAGTMPVVAVGAAPSHPSNTVVIQLRGDSGTPQPVRATRETASNQEGVQCFRAILPPVEEGRRLDYRVELLRVGQVVATLPADGSWLRMTGDGTRPLPSPRPARAHSSDTPSVGAPRWAYGLEFFAALTITLRPEIIGTSPEGYRINLLVESGHLLGPRIDAVVRREGGDYLTIRGDGVGVLDVRTIYETTDGALILYRAGGRVDIGPDGYAKVAAGQFTDCPPVYATPTFITSHPSWQWLNRLQGFAVGRVVMNGCQVEYDIYLPQVGGRVGDA